MQNIYESKILNIDIKLNILYYVSVMREFFRGIYSEYKKIFNNNVVVSSLEDGTEIIVTGAGVGFKKK